VVREAQHDQVDVVIGFEVFAVAHLPRPDDAPPPRSASRVEQVEVDGVAVLGGSAGSDVELHVVSGLLQGPAVEGGDGAAAEHQDLHGASARVVSGGDRLHLNVLEMTSSCQGT